MSPALWTRAHGRLAAVYMIGFVSWMGFVVSNSLLTECCIPNRSVHRLPQHAFLPADPDAQSHPGYGSLLANDRFWRSLQHTRSGPYRSRSHADPGLHWCPSYRVRRHHSFLRSC
jgi:hypothetical protein